MAVWPGSTFSERYDERKHVQCKHIVNNADDLSALTPSRVDPASRTAQQRRWGIRTHTHAHLHTGCGCRCVRFLNVHTRPCTTNDKRPEGDASFSDAHVNARQGYVPYTTLRFSPPISHAHDAWTRFSSELSKQSVPRFLARSNAVPSIATKHLLNIHLTQQLGLESRVSIVCTARTPTHHT